MGMFEINKDLLPMKAQYFLWNAGTAPIVPFLPTYARQLGFSSVIVGIIYTVLPIAGMLAKPLFGAIADRLKRQKMLFLIFQVVTIIAFFNIQFIPEIATESNTSLECGKVTTTFKVCSEDQADKCAAERVVADAGNIGTVHCQAVCNVTDTSLWEELCESWLVPQYCTSPETILKFTGEVPFKRIEQVKDCLYLNVHNATFDGDGTTHVPYCNDLYTSSCNIKCDDAQLSKLLVGAHTDIDCGAESNFRVCKEGSEDESKRVLDTLGINGVSHCQAECFSPDPLLLHEVCTTWKVNQYCSSNDHSASKWYAKHGLLQFTMNVPIEETYQNGSCVHFRVMSTRFPDGSTHTPYCNTTPSSNPCQIICDNAAVNEVIRKPATSDSQVAGLYQFWLFFLFVLVSWVGMAVVVSIGDAICFEMLGDNHSGYGRQRLWGAVGWGSLSIITGLLVDEFSKGQTMKNYTPMFYLMLILLLLDILVSSRLKHTQTKMSNSIVKDVGKLLGEVRIVVFLLWCICVGLCTAMVWNFLFWHLEDLALVEGCGVQQWTKTLQGLVMGIQSFGGELPFFFISGWILDKIGHVNAMSLVLLGFGVRFLLYSILVDPWWCLPIELFQGITFGIFYSTMASYASIIAPQGTEATVQGLVGAVFEGIGVSLGSLLGGVLFKAYGGSVSFRAYGIAALIACALHVIVQYCIAKWRPRDSPTGTTRYAPPMEAFHMLDERHQTLDQ